MARGLLLNQEAALRRRVSERFTMLPALGAASLALDAVKSLTSPAASSSSQAGDAFAPALSDVAVSSPASPSAATISVFGSTQISSDNITTLLNAQGLPPPDLGSAFGASDSISGSSQSPSVFASSAASSVYNAANQLTQSTALPLGLSPFSISV